MSTFCQIPVRMPIVGLGTWQAKPEEVEAVVNEALDAGYTHIDTAFNYNNEEAIGNCLKKWFDCGKGLRKDLFITTKLPHIGNRAKDVSRFMNLSLDRLQLDFVDLYLIHMPFSFKCDESTLTPAVNEQGEIQLDCENDLVATWKEMEHQVKQGKTRAIGLSNFNEEQIKRVYDQAEIKPAVLQVEMHAYLQQHSLVELCKSLNITITAYSPLGSPGSKTHFQQKYNYDPEHFPDILGHPVVQCIASKTQKTPGQVLLRFLVQQCIAVIPKSTNPERIRQNCDLFSFQLDEEDMEALKGLDKGEAGRIFNFKFFKGVLNHPEYPFKKAAT